MEISFHTFHVFKQAMASDSYSMERNMDWTGFVGGIYDRGEEEGMDRVVRKVIRLVFIRFMHLKQAMASFAWVYSMSRLIFSRFMNFIGIGWEPGATPKWPNATHFASDMSFSRCYILNVDSYGTSTQ